jgi:ectoine hydroxylase-related dioxygenase (phytanoyl-CoA dioxygenase family)
MAFLATSREREVFQRDGFVLVPELLATDEVNSLAEIARRDTAWRDTATTRTDASGASTILAVRDDLGHDVYSALVRSRRIAKSMEVLLDEEVYHYHHKLMLKEPRVGGAWEWHQDYGYWYGYGCLFPKMASCYIAIDRANRENGCLQVLPGSHHLGRIEHGKVGGQTGADQARMPAILDRFTTLHVEMQPGDGLFFHANLLHRSDQNRSENPRWSLICCYNARSNSPYEVVRHNGYKPLEILDDSLVFTD